MCDYQSIHDLYNTGDVCQPLKCKSTTMSNGKHIGNFLLSSDEMSDAQSAFSSSLYSTNYTMSNLVGPGRVLENLYSSLGRRLERSIGALLIRRDSDHPPPTRKFRIATKPFGVTDISLNVSCPILSNILILFIIAYPDQRTSCARCAA